MNATTLNTDIATVYTNIVFADHVEYNGTEYAPLVEWCTEHYPAAGGAGN